LRRFSDVFECDSRIGGSGDKRCAQSDLPDLSAGEINSASELAEVLEALS